jgi:RNA polymerase sigma factor (TIGR02999 family)
MKRKESLTQLLSNWRAGDVTALEQLTPLVYDELRRLAHKYMRAERSSHTLQATAVVHEAFVRLIQADVPMQDRVHFFAVASRLMRRILVDHAKGRSRQKRFGSAQQITLHDEDHAQRDESFDVVDLDGAIEQLTQTEPRLAQVIELHYFGGLTYEQIAEAMQFSPATVHRDIRLARAWLYNYLSSIS